VRGLRSFLRRLSWVALGGGVLAGCAPRQLPLSDAAPRSLASEAEAFCCAGGSEEITLQYLGVGGWLIRFGGSALLTAPFFSHPSLWEVGLGRIETDTARVDAGLPPVSDVQAVLVGHAHYDHLLDVPYVLRRHAPQAVVYGSQTAVHLLAGDPQLDPLRLREVESRAGDGSKLGEWVVLPGGRIRFLPLLSGHAPHLFGIHLFEGELREPAERLPSRAWGWVEGQNLAYLIDFLDPDGRVIFRLHYQDAASTPPQGYPPPLELLEEGRGVDLAIVCPPGFEQVEGYPEGLLSRLSPRWVLLGHWEDFFRPGTDPPRPVPTLDLPRFQARVKAGLPEGGRSVLPSVGVTYRILAEEEPPLRSSLSPDPSRL